MKSYQDFKAQVLGRGYDIDYNYGWQCWDGYAEYCRYLGVPYANCTVTHYVQDIWTQRATNGILNYFSETRILQPGDVVVFRPCSVTPTSHIAIFDSDAGGGYGNFLGQNQGGSAANPAGGYAFSIAKLPYWATYDTGFRPKSWSGSYENVSSIGYSEKQLINENGSCVLTQPVKKRRDRPDGIVAETLRPGKKLNYTQKWVGNGHRYISWVETEPSGNKYRYFVAISGSEKHGADLWATFEEPKPSTTAEHGWAKFKVDGVAVRKGSPTGEKVGQVSSGQVVEYTAKAATDSHRYIIYSKEGSDFYVACSPTAKRSTEWADFYATDPNKDDHGSTQDKTQKGDTNDHSVDTSSVKHWGIDLSENNKNVDISKFEFAILRASYGEYTDKKLDYFVSECKKHGIPYGLYCYDYALNDAEALAEANYILKLADQYQPTLGVWFDMEDADGYKKKHGVLTAERCLKSCQIFCKTIKQAGWYTGIYSSTWWFQNWLTSGLDDYDKWVAQWDINDGQYHSDTSSRGSIHQYTSIDKETGINIDKNAMYVDFDHYKNEEKDVKDDVIKKENEDKDVKDNTNKEKIQKKMIKQIINILKKMLKLC